jgi:excinuclease ABC subunit C
VADPSTYRPAPGEIPDRPGVYRFHDEHGRVIYVGKAKSLRQRLTSYFADLAGLHPRTRSMVTSAAGVDWVIVGTEVEALQLEYSWIKEYDPRFNVRYRDDKSYPYLAVSVGEEFPRAWVTRGAKRAGVRYFGPYAHAWAIRDTLDTVLRVFPIRTCSAGVFRRSAQTGRPCLLADLGKCSAPCVGRIDEASHRDLVDDLCSFLAGRTRPIEKRLEADMSEAAARLDYENAARYRDDLAALRRATERNAVVLSDGTDADVIGIADDDLEAAFEVFHVRGGRVRGQRGFVVEKVEDLDTAALLGRLLQRLYAESDVVPRLVLAPVDPEEAVVAWLAEVRGARVEVRVPQRGDKRDLLETVCRNAEQRLSLHKARRAGDLTARSLALQEIHEGLDLPSAPLRIECIDVSHLGGEGVVASLVVFEDGLPRSRDYRTFTLSAEGARDDTRSIHEVVTRRFARSQREDDVGVPETGVPPRRRFAYPPQLLVVDGGPPQVAAASAALRELGIEDLPVAGLAKRLEEVWLAGSPDPVILPRAGEGLYLLQRIRDEAHRTALRAQQRTRGRSRLTSILDDVPGLGPSRRRDLVRAFGSMKRLREATVDQLTEVPGIGPSTAEAVYAALHPEQNAGTDVDSDSGRAPDEAGLTDDVLGSTG